MRLAIVVAAPLALAALLADPPAARAEAAMPWPPYRWVQRSTLIVEGRVEKVADGTGTLRVSKTLAGKADADTIVFSPVTHPECMSGRMGTGEPQAADVAVGDEVALFLKQGDAGAFVVVDWGYAKVQLGGSAGYFRAPAGSVERLVAAMTAADQDARDRAMLEAAATEDEFLRRAACEYVAEDLGAAAPPAGTEGRRLDRAGPEFAAHVAAVRRHAVALAALVKRENGEEPCSAALTALADAACAPEGAFDAIAAHVRTADRLGLSSFHSACRVVASYDRADAVDVVVAYVARRPTVLAALGASPRPEARKRLLAEFGSPDPIHVVPAAQALAEWLSRGRDPEIEEALLLRLRGPAEPGMVAALSWALRSARPLDAANALLDKFAQPSVSKEAEEMAARCLYDYLRVTPPNPGVRDLVVTRQAVVIDRLDAGKTQTTRVLWVLSQLDTPEARSALRRAAESFPDPEIRREAKWRSERRETDR